MDINKLSLRNFKCFEKVDISLSKITLLTGPNSSGKSSLLYGLLGPLQSKGFPLYFSVNGKYVNMGDYREIVYKNLKNRSVGIDIIIGEGDKGDTYSIFTDWIADKRTIMPKLYRLRYKTSFCEIGILLRDKYILKLKFDPKEFAKGHGSGVIQALKPIYKLISKLAEEVGSKKRKKIKKIESNLFRAYDIKRRKFGSLEELTTTLPIVEVLLSSLSFTRRDLNFISSFRREPDRTYYEKTQVDLRVKKYGGNYIEQLVQWESQKAAEFQSLKSILRELNLVFSIKSQKLPGGRFELRVKVKNRDVWALLADVGFGISQLLPILVADLQLGRGSTLFVAQPEIHLHPSVQASLANYFVKQTKEKNKRYILETHSEYLINRIRLAIVQGKLKSSDVSVYYFDHVPVKTNTYNIKFAKDGRIENAPKSFFDTYMLDTMGIALNAK